MGAFEGAPVGAKMKSEIAPPLMRLAFVFLFATFQTAMLYLPGQGQILSSMSSYIKGFAIIFNKQKNCKILLPTLPNVFPSLFNKVDLRGNPQN